jgi:small-conductance mechanosensitive channel
VVDGLVRAQCAVRVSFSVDSDEAVRTLLPVAENVTEVLAAPPGVALLPAPARP